MATLKQQFLKLMLICRKTPFPNGMGRLVCTFEMRRLVCVCISFQLNRIYTLHLMVFIGTLIAQNAALLISSSLITRTKHTLVRGAHTRNSGEKFNDRIFI